MIVQKDVSTNPASHIYNCTRIMFPFTLAPRKKRKILGFQDRLRQFNSKIPLGRTLPILVTFTNLSKSMWLIKAMRTMSGDDDKRPPREMPLMKDALIFGTSPQSQALDFDSKCTATFC